MALRQYFFSHDCDNMDRFQILVFTFNTAIMLLATGIYVVLAFYRSPGVDVVSQTDTGASSFETLPVTPQMQSHSVETQTEPRAPLAEPESSDIYSRALSPHERLHFIRRLRQNRRRRPTPPPAHSPTEV